MPSLSVRAFPKWEVNLGSLSLIIQEGSPNHWYTWSRYSHAMPGPVIVSEHGRNIAACKHRSFFRIYLVEGCLLSMGEDLILLAVCTPFDVVHYPLMHTCPFAYFSGFSDGFILSWVSYSRVVVN